MTRGTGAAGRILEGVVAGTLAMVALALPLPGQEAAPAARSSPGGDRVAQAAPRVIHLPVGQSRVVTVDGVLSRVHIANPELADVAVVSSTEVVVSANQRGATSLIVWTRDGRRHLFTVRIGVDGAALEQDLAAYFPGAELRVRATGNVVVLSGSVPEPAMATKAVDIAQSLGEEIRVVDNIAAPDKKQVLLQVRFAEVSRSAMQEVGFDFLHIDQTSGQGDALSNIGELSGDFPVTGPVKTFSDAVNFFLFHRGTDLSLFIQALKENGLFRSLAEPNLLAMPGDSASFLAGGEFPFPVVQGGSAAGAVTIQFREFGIRLNFLPTITNSGAIRLGVTPEVSQLDFSRGLELSGFQIPALLSRRASTVVELGDGQTFAIAGLLDNSLTRNVSKVPFLGDIPILGELFRSESIQQDRSELLVLVTPHLVEPMDGQPPLPTGEPRSWEWDERMRDSLQEASADSLRQMLRTQGVEVVAPDSVPAVRSDTTREHQE